jgi:pimeloyl-ACP methyl ester carboxylesterase
MKKGYRRLIWIGLLSFGIFKLSGCLQFRDSPKKVTKNFQKRNLDLQLKTIHVNGRNLHFVRTNFSDSTKPLAIFVHGSPGASDNFEDNLYDSLLRTHFEMISVDRPGFGHSDFGRSMPALKDQAAFIGSLLDSFANRKIILIGHSYGGPVIVRMAIDFPNKIDGILIVAGSVDPELEPEEWWRKPADTRIGRWLLPKVMEVSNQEIMTLKADLIEMQPLWSTIKQPVYVLQGEKDGLVPPGNADFAKANLINSSWVKIDKVKDMNHFFPFTRHESITKAILELEAQIE